MQQALSAVNYLIELHKVKIMFLRQSYSLLSEVKNISHSNLDHEIIALNDCIGTSK